MPKFTPIRKYFTLDELAIHWKCEVDDIKHLVELGELSLVHRIVAKSFDFDLWKKQGRPPSISRVAITACKDLNEYYEKIAEYELSEHDPYEYEAFTYLLDGESVDDAINRKESIIKREGGFDDVVLINEVERFEAEFSERFTGKPTECFTVKPAGTQAPNLTVEGDGSGRRRRIQRNRAAIESARAELLKAKHREPTTDEVFFFLENDPSGTFFDVKNDALLWEDSRGKTHSMTRKRLEKLLSNIRNAT
ncbi:MULTISPECIES: hypothetical protein [unclassified Methylococcus]|uniref:hypothetical protein n=1 Tax=unclassified Methylococcus TaxID=2618889 RepID=UPI003D7D59EC